MLSIGWLLFFYFFGGVTFLPILVVAVFLFFYWTSPSVKNDVKVGTIEKDATEADDLQIHLQQSKNENFVFPPLEQTSRVLKKRQMSNGSIKSSDSISSAKLLLEKEVETGVDAQISGWILVSREYFLYPNGIVNNSTQKGRNTYSKENVYSNFLNILSPSTKQESVDNDEKTEVTKSSKKPKIVKYFAVLRHGNLFLYESADKKDVKHAIVIANYTVSIWPPNLKDGELFAKRHAICLVKTPEGSPREVDFKLAQYLSNPLVPPKNSYFLYFDVTTEKEDFYFTLIRASKKYNLHSLPKAVPISDTRSPFNPVFMAHPSHFKTSEMMDLIQNLHSSDANIQTRWINAIIGRLFLSSKDTKSFENFFRNRIMAKLSRTKRPSFLSEIEVTKVIPGDSIPFITNPRLLELTPEGKLSVGLDISYSGGIAVEISTKVLLNFGSRFKTREVPIVLLVQLLRLDGNLIFKMKSPPSGRLWYAFEKNPIVS